MRSSFWPSFSIRIFPIRCEPKGRYRATNGTTESDAKTSLITSPGHSAAPISVSAAPDTRIAAPTRNHSNWILLRAIASPIINESNEVLR